MGVKCNETGSGYLDIVADSETSAEKSVQNSVKMGKDWSKIRVS